MKIVQFEVGGGGGGGVIFQDMKITFLPKKLEWLIEIFVCLNHIIC